MNDFHWNAIYGQQAAVASLRGVIQSGRIGHAYLFSGPRGVGRRFTASVFAAALSCVAEDAGARPCGVCEACDAFTRGIHPDMYRMQPVDGRILIDQVRALQQRVSLKTIRGRHKVFIIESIEAATEQAQNALLKVLEEPAGNAVFILVAEEGSPPLPTIVSRCSTVRFGPLSRHDATRVLQERFQYGDAAPLAAALGDASVDLARKMTPDELLERRRKALALLDCLLGQLPAVAAVQTELWYKERDELSQLLDMMQLYLRDVLLCQQVPSAVQEPQLWLVNYDRVDELAARALSLPSADVIKALDAFIAYRRRIAQNVGIRSALNVLFLELTAAGRPAAS